MGIEEVEINAHAKIGDSMSNRSCVMRPSHFVMDKQHQGPNEQQSEFGVDDKANTFDCA